MEEIIDFAIQREQEAQRLYLGYAAHADRTGFRQLLVSMAEMEREHERKLRKLKEGEASAEWLALPPSEDLKLSEFLVDMEFSDDMDYGDFLTLIIKKEDSAERLYRRLADQTHDSEMRSLFQNLAEEERRHKSWAQDRYDLEILKEN